MSRPDHPTALTPARRVAEGRATAPPDAVRRGGGTGVLTGAQPRGGSAAGVRGAAQPRGGGVRRARSSSRTRSGTWAEMSPPHFATSFTRLEERNE